MRGKDPERLRKVFDHLYQIEPLTRVVADFMGEDTVVFLCEAFYKLYPYDAYPLLISKLRDFGREHRETILKTARSKNPLHGQEALVDDDDQSLGFYAVNLTLKMFYNFFWDVYYA